MSNWLQLSSIKAYKLKPLYMDPGIRQLSKWMAEGGSQVSLHWKWNVTDKQREKTRMNLCYWIGPVVSVNVWF